MPFISWRVSRPGDLRRSLLWTGLVAAAALVVPILAMASPWLPECNFHRWTGVACPSCGATRAVVALARGRIATAFRWNPLVALAGSGLVLSALAAPFLVLGLRRVPVIAERIPAWVFWLLAAAVAANWAYLVVSGV